MLINKEFLKVIKLWMVSGILLLITSLITPFWYDDVGHSLVVYQLVHSGNWGFPLNYPHITEYHKYSTMISVGPALHYPASWIFKFLEWDFYVLRFWMALLNAFFPVILFHFSTNFFHPQSRIFSTLLLTLNVQYFVYGSQYIGEIFMMECLILGIFLQFKALFQKKKYVFLGSQFCFYLAILTKEYIALPLGLYLFFTWIVWSIAQKKWFNALLLQGLTLPLASVLFYFFQFDNFNSFQVYWAIKKDYQKEFLNLGYESLVFLMKKPLITLGTIAILVKVAIRKDIKDIFFMILQFFLLFFFLLSQGYDRLGFLLFPISSLYLAEWLQFIWNFQLKNTFHKIIFVILFIIFFSQNLFNPWYWYSQWEKKVKLIELSQAIENLKIKIFFTYEVEFIPYVKGVSIKTTGIPPVSSHRIQENIQEMYFLVGEYARTEYPQTWKRSDYVRVWKYGNYEMLKLNRFKKSKNY